MADGLATKCAEGVKVLPKNLSKQSAAIGKRKVGRPSNLNESVVAAIRLLHQLGVGKRKIAKKLSVGVGSVMAVL
jgi:hypothetical protein